MLQFLKIAIINNYSFKIDHKTEEYIYLLIFYQKNVNYKNENE